MTIITAPPSADFFPLLVSDNVSAPLSLTLSPGWYGLIFGTGHFGANGGDMIATQTINGVPANVNGVLTYSVRQSDGTQFVQAPGARFFVEGTVLAVPAPPAWALLFIGISLQAGIKLRKRIMCS